MNHSNDVYRELKDKVFKLVRILTRETESEQINRYMNEPGYRSVIDEMTNNYFLIATNIHFQEEQEELLNRMKLIFNL